MKQIQSIHLESINQATRLGIAGKILTELTGPRIFANEAFTLGNGRIALHNTRVTQLNANDDA